MPAREMAHLPLDQGPAGPCGVAAATAPAADRSAQPEQSRQRQDGAVPSYLIVLKPLSHPELADIGIDENLFAVGRTETPFAGYPAEVVSDLSRRHARIFCEGGVVHVADMGSKNGTAINGIDIRQKTARLQNGDDIRFGRTLTYRVELAERAPLPPARLVSLTLQPTQQDLGLQPIVVAEFPFLISKADVAFSRYKQDHPHQVNYLSRRHAHVFLRRGMPFVEDLGSTNGSFVNGKRLEEHAVALQPGDTVAFGGHYFVYQVSLQTEDLQADPTLTRFTTVASVAVGPVPAFATPAFATPTAGTTTADSTLDPEKTTFIAAADSFLDIFCIDQAPPADPAPDAAADPMAAGETGADVVRSRDQGPARSPRRQRWSRLMAQASGLLSSAERQHLLRRVRWSGAVLTAAMSIGLAVYLGGADVREIRNLVAQGEHARAATLAARYLQQHPDNAEVRALDTEAVLKSALPGWLQWLAQRQFDRADAALAAMQTTARPNPDLTPLLHELDWIGRLERFAAGRSGADAPIRIYTDEDRMTALLRQWDDDPLAHQRVLATIAVHVPAFREPYALALSHLRRLQSENAVYLAAIERLKTGVDTELQRGHPEAIEALLKATAEKYPRIAGLAVIRADLQRAAALDRALRDTRLGPMVTVLARTRFTTPPFQNRLGMLTAAGRLPPAEVLMRYQGVQAAWHRGDIAAALASLQSMNTGPWAPAAHAELQHKRALAEQFAGLERSRGAAGRDERLLTFYETLDPDEDEHFVQTVEADAGFDRNRATRRARQRLDEAGALWQRYRQGGSIDDAERLDATVSDQFRAQAGMLSQALQAVHQGLRLLHTLKAEAPARSRQSADEIAAEAELQRSALLGARSALAPDVLQVKLALLDAGGGPDAGAEAMPAGATVEVTDRKDQQ